MLYYFCLGTPVGRCARFLNGKVSENSCVQWYNYFREIMMTYNTQNPPRFNGTAFCVQCDETAIGGKLKYHKGRYKKEPRWLFGIVSKVDHKILLQFILDKDSQNAVLYTGMYC